MAGSIFTFSLTLGDYITPTLVGGDALHRQRRLPFGGVASDVPFAAAFATVPLVVMGVYLVIARRLGAFEAPVTRASPAIALGVWAALIVLFLYVPDR